MATRLKKMRLTSVDLVPAGANQEADICLYKSADPAEAAEQPTEGEKNIFKRFISWLRENPAEAAPAGDTPVAKDYTTFNAINANRESNEKLWRYTDALTQSIRSIQEDNDLDQDRKLQMMQQSLNEFNSAMEELFTVLSVAKDPNRPKVAKSSPDIIEIQEIQKKK